VSTGPGLDRARVAAGRVERLQHGGRRSPDVWLVEEDGRRFVVKDFAESPAWARATWGRWLVGRELRAYRRLIGHPQVPRLLGRVDAWAFAVEYRPGRCLSRRLAGELAPDFLPRLETAVRGMHERGVVHLDLRHRSNVLVDARGEPVLLDFASAVCVPGRSAIGRVLLGLLARFDLGALRKWQERLAPAQSPAPPSVEVEPLAGDGTEGTSSVGRRGASRPT
jgi:hypothetical protein